MNGELLVLNSLILIGPTFRTFSAAVTDCFTPLALVHDTVATRSPLKVVGPDVTLKVAPTLAPGATGAAKVFEIPAEPEATAVHPFGVAMLSLTPVAGASVEFVKITAVSCEEPGENVCSPGGAVVAAAGARLSGCAPYFAATTLACTS